MTGPEVTQPDPDGGVEMTDGEWAAFRGVEVTAAMKAEDAWVEKGARAMWNAQTRQPWQQIEDGDEWPSWVDLATRDRLREKFRHALAAVLPEIVAKAYEEAADTVAREVDVVWPSQRNEKASYAAEVLRANARAAREGKPAPYAAHLPAATEEPTT